MNIYQSDLELFKIIFEQHMRLSWVHELIIFRNSHFVYELVLLIDGHELR